MTTVSTQSTYGLALGGIPTTLIVEGEPAIQTDALLREKFGLDPLPNFRVVCFRRQILGKFKWTAWFYGQALRYVARHRTCGKPVVITRNSTLLPYLIGLKKWLGLIVIFEAHGYHGDQNLPDLPPRPPRRLVERFSAYRLIEHLCLNRCDGLVCITRPQERLYLADFVRIPTRFLPLGAHVSGDEVDPNQLPQYERKSLVYIGRLTAHIDVDRILEAIHLCRHSGITFTWLGLRDQDKAEIAPKVAEKGLTGIVQLKTWLPHKEMMEFIRKNASAGLVNYKPTFRSAGVTCPTKIFDYYRAGLPVVASRMPTVEDVMTDGEQGVMFTPQDAASLADALHRLFADPVEYRRMQQAALAAAKYYSWQNRGKRLIEFIETLDP